MKKVVVLNSEIVVWICWLFFIQFQKNCLQFSIKKNPWKLILNNIQIKYLQNLKATAAEIGEQALFSTLKGPDPRYVDLISDFSKKWWKLQQNRGSCHSHVCKESFSWIFGPLFLNSEAVWMTILLTSDPLVLLHRLCAISTDHRPMVANAKPIDPSSQFSYCSHAWNEDFYITTAIFYSSGI